MEDRLTLAQQYISEGHTKHLVVRFTGISKSWYYQSIVNVKGGCPGHLKAKRHPIPGYSKSLDGTLVLDSAIVKILKDYRSQIEFQNAGGYQKLYHYLKRDHSIIVNPKKIYRLCKENDLLLPRNKKKIKNIRKVCYNRQINGPNQIWEFDIKYGYILGENQFFFLLAFIDVFTREPVDYYVGKSCKAIHLKNTFENALRLRGISAADGLVIRSDNGPQMTSNIFRKYIEDLKADHEFIPPGDSNKNAHVESFFSIYELEFLQVRTFWSYQEAYQQTVEWMEFYKAKRIHGSLNNMSPIDFIRSYKQGNITIPSIAV